MVRKFTICCFIVLGILSCARKSQKIDARTSSPKHPQWFGRFLSHPKQIQSTGGKIFSQLTFSPLGPVSIELLDHRFPDFRVLVLATPFEGATKDELRLSCARLEVQHLKEDRRSVERVLVRSGEKEVPEETSDKVRKEWLEMNSGQVVWNQLLPEEFVRCSSLDLRLERRVRAGGAIELNLGAIRFLGVGESEYSDLLDSLPLFQSEASEWQSTPPISLLAKNGVLIEHPNNQYLPSPQSHRILSLWRFFGERSEFSSGGLSRVTFSRLLARPSLVGARLPLTPFVLSQFEFGRWQFLNPTRLVVSDATGRTEIGRSSIEAKTNEEMNTVQLELTFSKEVPLDGRFLLTLEYSSTEKIGAVTQSILIESKDKKVLPIELRPVQFK